MTASTLAELIGVARRVTAGSQLAGEVAGVEERLARPLRVAIAGRAKSGKSTLLNALVGERLAATDATECTRVVTWYRYDLGYSVTAHLRSGAPRALEFERGPAGLQIRLGELGVGEIQRLEVGWPSRRLADLTLIDTPGLDSSSAGTSQRTVEALVGEDEPGDADAVVYLMRHLHRRDAEFLEAFEQPLAIASPVNAVALLSRADELGGGHAGALDSATSIAARYAADPRIARVALTVLPLAGLLAETAASLTESEVAALRALAALDEAAASTLFLSVDRFRSRPENPLPVDRREALLGRFGLFGLRRAVSELRAAPATSSSDLARRLVALSRIDAVEALLRRQFADRADALKARSALAGLRAVARAARRDGLPGADDLMGGLERVEASSPQLAELRALHLVHTGRVESTDEERAELDLLLGRGSLAERLDQPIGTGPGELAPIALGAIERWRTRAAHPMLDREAVEVAEVVARAYEGVYRELLRSQAAAASRRR